MIRPKILIFIDWFLPGTQSGGPVRSIANLITNLASDFDFYIVTRNSDFGSNKPYTNITANKWIRFNSSTEIYYISRERLRISHLKDILNHQSFDLAYINGIYSWYFSILPIILLKKLNKKCLIAARGMLNPQAFSVKAFKKRLFLRLAKTFKLYYKVTFHATSLQESDCIKDILGSETRVYVASNMPRSIVQKELVRRHVNKPMRCINLARISIEKGTLIMLEALKDVDHAMLLDLYGPIYDQSYWARCQRVIKGLPKHINVKYRGIANSEDVPKILSNYHFFILLSQGENFGHAIIEALAAGCPVLISDKTPWKNLEQQQIGLDINISENYNIVSAFDKALTMSEDTYLKWSKNAFLFAQNFKNNSTHKLQAKTLFLNLINED